MNKRAVLYAILSAALFGVLTPLAKILLETSDPFVVAGLLYLGAGVGIALIRRLPIRGLIGSGTGETSLGRSELPWLAAAIAAGGVAGPLLLMAGLARTEASTASLLLTLEGVATALIAWFIFHENFDRRIAIGMAALVAGAVILAWSGPPGLTGLSGPLLIAGACMAWGLDNNLTRKVSLSDPLQIVELKGLIAGPVNLAVGMAGGAALPGMETALDAAVLGFFGIGVSLVYFVLALRDLGTARTGAYFSTAPILGALSAVLVLAEPITPALVMAGLFMGFGVWLHLTEHHEHAHEHKPIEHAHAHVHDEHHRYEQDPDDPAGEPHTHRHRHERMTHSHPHVPDMHHTHRH